MCEVNVYLIENNKEELFQKEADVIKPQEDGLFMKNIFGEQKTIRGKLTRYDNREGKIIIEPI